MDAGVERSGALHYSVEIPPGDVSAERPIITGSVITLLTSALTFALGWLALGQFSSQRAVVRLSQFAILAVAAGVTGWMTRTGFRRRRRNGFLGVGAVALFCALVVGNILGLAKPTIPQLRAALDALELPATLEQVDEEAIGSRICDPRCPQVSRRYRVRSPAEDPVRLVMDAVFAQGWRPADPHLRRDLQSAAVRGPIQLDVFSSGPTEVRIVVTNGEIIAPPE